ncbi:hypothetical protein RSOLAG1IB_08309 [Rhizoctonia solani AG-1 IB]|uniref:Uncharacterized protein n=1 Tax=Thanatephorus cucumeris (strain AG1-IB / isolate 7/3/14) TaxID=1108050 RepID=M5CAK3_THACB|nr:hypothetical protein BN14_10488 [Rhizoctonia solani AG-1 IB]CEL57056.1 hypothetical protein RSOLAG1IB_08309 [Rhizoctonia solani AG-1 IB]
MAETTGASSWSLEGLKDALMGGNKANATEEDKTQATLNAALREETKLKEERGEATSGWRKMLADMTKDKGDLDEEIKKLEQELAALKADEADDTWTEKIAARFDGSQDARRAKITELETKLAELKKQEAEKQEGWKGKLKDIFDGEDEEGKERLKQEVNKEVSWKDKLGEQFFGAPKSEPKKEEFSLSGKLNELAGGGRKSEANEDKLDKAIDLYQEHVLKQGPQDNESAFEQAKDEQISDALRAGFRMVTGKEIPLKDKEH